MDIAPSSSLHIKLSSFTPTISTTAMSASIPSSKPSKPTVYFGYGSNLWQHQMRLRCPTSKFIGLARLKGYKWIIYERGYANIVEVDEEDEEERIRNGTEVEDAGNGKKDKHDYASEVWGLVYTLQPSDERKLDVNEGVPVAYQKELISCEYWKTSDTWKKPEKLDMLVYINRDMTEEAESKKEYVYRMNMGIKDAIREGVPEEYFEQVLRKFIPKEEDEDEEVKEIARRQAVEFEDES